MKKVSLFLLPLMATLLAQTSSSPAKSPASDNEPVRLPNGKLQSDEILKEDLKKNLKDVQEMIDIAQSLKSDMERDKQFVLSVADLKKTEDIEKLARRIRAVSYTHLTLPTNREV